MKPLAPIALLWLIVFTCAAPAEARGGCGRGSHRGYYGRCNENMAHAHRAARYHRHDSDPTMRWSRHHHYRPNRWGQRPLSHP